MSPLLKFCSDSLVVPVSQGSYIRGIVATGYTYPVVQSYVPYDVNQEIADEKTVYYDPVRDMTR
jgi:hypothetical protein